MVNLSDRKHVLRIEKAIGKPIRKITKENPTGYLDDGENVIELRLPRMGIEEFPYDICNLPYLKVLDLNYNKIGEVPSAIERLKNLEKFYIGRSIIYQSNRIHELPEEMKGLVNLRVLDLTGHAIQKLPRWIGSFSRLERLLLGGNMLKSIPSEIGKLSELKELQLWSNLLDKLPKSMRNLRLLKNLLLSKNALKETPKWIGDLIALERLDLEENQIKKLPKEIGRLKYLKELNLASNKIENLPEEFCSLDSLEQIDLSGNHFKRPIDHICLEELKSLKWINIEMENLSTDAMALLIDRKIELESIV